MPRTLVALAVTLFLAASSLPAQEKTTFHSLNEALAASRNIAGRTGPRSVNWINGGKRFSFTVPTEEGEEIRALDPATGQDTLLFSAKGLNFPDTAAPFSYQSFQWSRDSRNLIFQTRFTPIYRRSGTADYFVYSLADRTMQLAAQGARTAELSPDGSMLGFERDGDLFVYSMGQRKEKRLTTGATETLHNGRFDWVYEEEFGMAQAWNWSPDNRYLAFWQVDESPEPITQLTDCSGWHPE